MESSKLDPAELWDEHVRKLQAIESEMQQTEAFLESEHGRSAYGILKTGPSRAVGRAR